MRHINPRTLRDLLSSQGIEYYCGVPDSLVSSLSFFLHDTHPANHTITANEGNAIGLAIGYHLATSKIPVVYMQNSGLSNALDPLASLADVDVLAIPMLLLVSWRGQPGIKDEPQHIRQGAITTPILEFLDIPYEVLSRDSKEMTNQVARAVKTMKANSQPYVLLIEKDFFSPYGTPTALTNSQLTRESAIAIVAATIPGEAIIVSGIGKVSRELFEYREHSGQSHNRDVLVVGGMGHASSVALGIAEQQQDRLVYCLDGDGAVRMHMGALATIGAKKPGNLIHIIFHNGVHDSVGGQQISGPDIALDAIALGCGYQSIQTAHDEQSLRAVLQKDLDNEGLRLIIVHVQPGARKDLGRPTTKPSDAKHELQSFLRKTL